MTTKEQPWKFKLKLIAFIAVLAVLSALAVISVRVPMDPRKHRLIGIAGNLKQIGIALKIYAMDNDDVFPNLDGADGMEMLRSQNYIKSYELYTCKIMKTSRKSKHSGPLREEDVGCFYRSGLTEQDSPHSTIAWTKPDREKGSGVILYRDGQVKWIIDDPNWRRHLDKTSRELDLKWRKKENKRARYRY